MNYDLRPAFLSTKQRLLETIQKFAAEHPDARVAGLELEFDIDPGLLCVHIETRPVYTPGTAFEMEFVNYAERDEAAWGEFDAAIFQENCHLITHLGDSLQFTPAVDDCHYAITGDNVERYRFEDEGDHFLQALGLMLMDVVAEIRDEGGFAGWQLSPAAVYNVVNMHGYFYRSDYTCPTLHPGKAAAD